MSSARLTRWGLRRAKFGASLARCSGLRESRNRTEPRNPRQRRSRRKRKARRERRERPRGVGNYEGVGMSRHEEDEDERYYVIEEKGGGVGSFLLGAMVGAGIALLLAPQSGEETRRDIKRKARQVSDAARDAAGDLQDTVAD